MTVWRGQVAMFSSAVLFLMCTAPAAGQERIQRRMAEPPLEVLTKLTPEQQWAAQLLESAVGQARSAEPPMRAFAMWQIANGYMRLDRAKAAEYLGEAFDAVLASKGDTDKLPAGMQQVQQRIVADLLQVDPARAEAALPALEPRERARLVDNFVNHYVRTKNFDKAVELIRQVGAVGEYPVGAAMRVMEALPPERDAEFRELFTQALANSSKQPEARGELRTDDMAAMIGRFHQRLGGGVVLEAADEVLRRARETDEKWNVKVGMESAKGAANFNSLYEAKLFELLPAIRHYDKDKAERLLRQSQEARLALERLPQGVESLRPEDLPSAPGPGDGMSRMFSSSPKGSQGGQAGQGPAMETNRVSRMQMEESFNLAGKEPRQAIAAAMALPAREGNGTSPRAMALERIAQMSVEKNPSAAEEALAELLKTIEGEMFANQQIDMLRTAGDIYLKLEKPEQAAKVVEQGMKAARRLYDEDTDREKPNEAVKAFWPSTLAWRTMLRLSAQVSPAKALEVLKEIPDEEIQASERVAIANQLLGTPGGTSLMVKQSKGSTMMSVMQNESTNEPRRSSR